MKEREEAKQRVEAAADKEGGDADAKNEMAEKDE